MVALAVSSGFKREAIAIKNHDAQSLIRWSHVLFLGAPQVCPWCLIKGVGVHGVEGTTG